MKQVQITKMLFSFSKLIIEISLSQKLKGDQIFPNGEISK